MARRPIPRPIESAGRGGRTAASHPGLFYSPADFALLRQSETLLRGIMRALLAQTDRAAELRQHLFRLMLEEMQEDLVELALGVFEGASAPKRRAKAK